jgi:hypothetical protein
VSRRGCRRPNVSSSSRYPGNCRDRDVTGLDWTGLIGPRAGCNLQHRVESDARAGVMALSLIAPARGATTFLGSIRMNNLSPTEHQEPTVQHLMSPLTPENTRALLSFA